MSWAIITHIDQGIASARPAAGSVPGRHYGWWSTDTKELSISDGSTWTTIGPTSGSGVTYGTPAIALGTAAAAGSIDEAIRRDATVVAFDATSPTTQAFGDSAVVGTAAAAARRDHKHAMPATPTSVSGNAGTATALQTARAIDGQNFDGTAAITVIAPGTHAATGKTTPVDADELPLVDSAASNVLKKLTWANVKATLKTYFDTLYPSGSGTSSGTNTGDQTTVSGNAGTATALATPRTINGTSFDGTANIVTAMGTLTRSPRSSNTILAAADRGTVICATSAYTQTLTAAATLGAGWWCIVKNDTQDGTTVLVLDPNASETIDGLATITMYSGETRLIECDGANFTSQLLEGGYAKFVPSGLGTFVVPAGITFCDVVCIGPGGQGGGGFSGSGSGGAGGGGGAVSRAAFRPGDLGSAGTSITVTAAAGGSGALAGANGTDGATTTFGTLLKAGGGGGGLAGASATTNTGGGGGSAVNSASGVTAGSPAGGSVAIGSQGAASVVNTGGQQAEWGGASGGGSAASASNAAKQGGSSIYGGPGGGPGGANNGTSAAAPGDGGATQSYTRAGGGTAGTSGATTTKGNDGTFVGPYCGSAGGGGGGGNTGVTGKVGGTGSIGAGGGGGGSSANTTAAAGGPGGPGECRVTYH